jgi:hypothetical protein
MHRFVIPATLGDAIACPSCGRVHRNIRMRRRANNELPCDCGATIVIAADIVHEIVEGQSV